MSDIIGNKINWIANHQKIKSKKCKVNENFHDEWILQENSNPIYQWVALIDSANQTNKNYYPRVFLE